MEPVVLISGSNVALKVKLVFFGQIYDNNKIIIIEETKSNNLWIVQRPVM